MLDSRTGGGGRAMETAIISDLEPMSTREVNFFLPVEVEEGGGGGWLLVSPFTGFVKLVLLHKVIYPLFCLREGSLHLVIYRVGR